MKRKLTTEEFIEKAKSIHGDKYDYSKVIYKTTETKICIICKKCGNEFWQTPHSHLQGRGCYECAKLNFGEYKRSDKEIFIEEALKIHKNHYNHSKVNYINNYTKVDIICNKCNCTFSQKPNDHLNGCGCPYCAKNKKLTTETFIEKANLIHNNKFNYSKTYYVNSREKVCIICPEHGEFWQRAVNHLSGFGCSVCKESKLEKEIVQLLNKNNIKYERQKTFDWLKNKLPLEIDFYLPDYNIVIECQGEQHFKPVNFGSKNRNSNQMLEYVQNNDKIKFELCNKNKIDLLYFSNLECNNYLSKIYTSKNELIKYIKSSEK